MNLRHWILPGALVALSLSACLHGQTLASANPPAYPLAAKAAGIEGQVILHAIISKEGKVLNLRVVSGPPELRQAAIDAVQSWKYKPYLQAGQPVDVDTTIQVNFNMGKGKKKAEEQAKAQAELAKSSQPAATSTATPPPQSDEQVLPPKQ